MTILLNSPFKFFKEFIKVTENRWYNLYHEFYITKIDYWKHSGKYIYFTISYSFFTILLKCVKFSWPTQYLGLMYIEQKNSNIYWIFIFKVGCLDWQRCIFNTNFYFIFDFVINIYKINTYYCIEECSDFLLVITKMSLVWFSIEFVTSFIIDSPFHLF